MTDWLRAVIFDMDNTLADTTRVYEQALVDLARQHLAAPPTARELLRHFGTPTPRILAHFAPPEQVAVMMADWPNHILRYREQICLFPGVRGLLEEFRAAGLRLGVVTSQVNAEFDIVRAEVGLDDLIEVWINSEMVARPKPNPDPVLAAVRRLGILPLQGVMVGDSFNDLEAGQRAGLRIGAALWGALNPQRLLAYRPHFIFRQVEEMRVLLDQTALRPAFVG